MNDPGWHDYSDYPDPSEYDIPPDQGESYDYSEPSAYSDPTSTADFDVGHGSDHSDDRDSHQEAPHPGDHDADQRWESISGHPAQAAGHWHEQERDDTSVIACQQFVLDDLTGFAPSEAELSALAEDLGWHVPGGGTPLYDMGHLLEHYGLQVSQSHGGGLTDLEHALEHGMNVIVALSDYQTLHVSPGLDLDAFPGIPGQEPEHAVQVIGVESSAGTGQFVVLNDPANPGGRGLEVPLADFLEAWASSGNYIVLAGGGTVA